MKNLFLSAAILLGTLSSFAKATPIANTIVKTGTVADAYTEIKVGELPVAITDALKKMHPDAVINKAYKNENSEYKLDVTIGEKGDQHVNLFATADGTWITK